MADDIQNEARRLRERGLFYLTCGLKEDALAVLEQAADLAPDDAELRGYLDQLRPPPVRKGRVIGIQPRTQRTPEAAAPKADLEPEATGETAPESTPESTPESPATGATASEEPTADEKQLIQTFSKAYAARDWPRALAMAQRRLFLFDDALQSHDRAESLAPRRPTTFWPAPRPCGTPGGSPKPRPPMKQSCRNSIWTAGIMPTPACRWAWCG